MAQRELTVPDRLALLTCSAAVLEAAYWIAGSPFREIGGLVQLLFCVVLLGAAALSGTGWLLQRKGPMWSRAVGWALMAVAGAVVALCTCLLAL